MQDEIQLLVTGMAIGLCDTSKMLKKLTIQDREEELIFNLEDEHQLQSSYNQPQYSVDQQQQQRSIRSPGHHLVQTGSLKVNPSAHTEQHRKFAAASVSSALSVRKIARHARMYVRIHSQIRHFAFYVYAAHRSRTLRR